MSCLMIFGLFEYSMHLGSLCRIVFQHGTDYLFELCAKFALAHHADFLYCLHQGYSSHLQCQCLKQHNANTVDCRRFDGNWVCGRV